MLVADVVHLAKARGQRFVVIRQLSDHVQGLDVFRIVIEHALSSRNVADRSLRKIGGLTLRSIGHISRTQRVLDNDAEYVEPLDMIAELADDNKTLAARLREAHNVCDEHRDVATASLIEVWIDETEPRTWFLSEIKRGRQL